MKYRVLTKTLGEPEDCWMEDDKPMRFDSREEAQAEIDSHIEDCEEAVANDCMEEVPGPDDFVIEGLTANCN